jgi:chromosome segregation ATPase
MSITDIANQVIASINDEFNDQVENLQEEIGSVRGQVEDAGSQLDGHWQDLSTKGQALIAGVQEAESEMVGAAEQLRGKAEEVGSRLEQAMSQADQITEQTRAGLDSLTQGVEQLIPDADEVMSKVEEAIGQLNEEVQSLDMQLEETRSATDQHIHNEFNSLVEDVKSQADQTYQEFSSYVTSSFIPTVVDQVSEFKGHIDQVVDEATTKLDEVQTNSESQSSSAMDQMKEMFGSQFTEAIDTVQKLQKAVEDIGDAITNVGDVASMGMGVMSAATASCGVGINAAYGIIKDMTELFDIG